jgi:hypothetical protein
MRQRGLAVLMVFAACLVSGSSDRLTGQHTASMLAF